MADNAELEYFRRNAPFRALPGKVDNAELEYFRRLEPFAAPNPTAPTTTPVSTSVAVTWDDRAQISQSVAVTWADNAAVAKSVAPTWDVRARVDRLVDQFSSLAAYWTTTTGSTISSGRLRQDASSATLATAYIHDLADSSIAIKADLSGASGSFSTRLFVDTDSTDVTKFAGWLYSGASMLGFYLNNASVGSLTYDPAVHVYWRIRQSGSTVYGDTSVDGLAWTQRYSASYTPPATPARVRLASASGSGYVYYDDLNVKVGTSVAVTWGVSGPVAPPSTKAITWATRSAFIRLVDDFNGSALDAKWDPSESPGATVSGGRLSFPATGNSHTQTYYHWDMLGSSISAKVTPPSDYSTSGFTAYLSSVRSDQNTMTPPGGSQAPFEMGLEWVPGLGRSQLLMGTEFGATYIDYDPAVHVYWRLREASGVYYHDTSVDGITWTNRASRAYSGLSPTAMAILLHNTNPGGGTAGPTYFDKINLSPLASPLTVAATWYVNPTSVPVSTSVAATWSIGATISTSTAATWSDRALVGAVVAATWTDRVVVATSQAPTWGVLSAVLSDLALTWSDRALVAASVAPTWQLAERITATAAPTWQVRELVGASWAITWLTESLTSAVTALDLSWSVRQQISLSVAPAWSDLAVVAPGALAITWNDRAAVALARALTWNDRAVVELARAASWQTRILVSTALAVTWSDLTPASTSVGTTWQVRIVPSSVAEPLFAAEVLEQVSAATEVVERIIASETEVHA